MAQDSTRPGTAMAKYHWHVHQAEVYENHANSRRTRYMKRLMETNPNASTEWYEAEASKDHYFKSFVSTQQFHVRQATMYGLGAILEALSSSR